jgi:hypothetical protein
MAAISITNGEPIDDLHREIQDAVRDIRRWHNEARQRLNLPRKP